MPFAPKPSHRRSGTVALHRTSPYVGPVDTQVTVSRGFVWHKVYQYKPNNRALWGFLTPKYKSHPFAVGLPLFGLRTIDRTLFVNAPKMIVPLQLSVSDTPVLAFCYKVQIVSFCCRSFRDFAPKNRSYPIHKSRTQEQQHLIL